MRVLTRSRRLTCWLAGYALYCACGPGPDPESNTPAAQQPPDIFTDLNGNGDGDDDDDGGGDDDPPAPDSDCGAYTAMVCACYGAGSLKCDSALAAAPSTSAATCDALTADFACPDGSTKFGGKDPFPDCVLPRGDCDCRNLNCCYLTCDWDDSACEDACDRDYGHETACDACGDRYFDCVNDNGCSPGDVFDRDCAADHCAAPFRECFCDNLTHYSTCGGGEEPHETDAGGCLCVPHDYDGQSPLAAPDNQRDGACTFGTACDDAETVCMIRGDADFGVCTARCRDEDLPAPPAPAECLAGENCIVIGDGSQAVCYPANFSGLENVPGSDGARGGRCGFGTGEPPFCDATTVCIGRGDDPLGMCAAPCPVAGAHPYATPGECEPAERCLNLNLEDAGVCVPDGAVDTLTPLAADGERGGRCGYQWGVPPLCTANTSCIGRPSDGSGICLGLCPGEAVAVPPAPVTGCAENETCVSHGGPYPICYTPSYEAEDFAPQGEPGQRFGACDPFLQCAAGFTCYINFTGAHFCLPYCRP